MRYFLILLLIYLPLSGAPQMKPIIITHKESPYRGHFQHAIFNPVNHRWIVQKEVSKPHWLNTTPGVILIDDHPFFVAVHHATNRGKPPQTVNQAEERAKKIVLQQLFKALKITSPELQKQIEPLIVQKRLAWGLDFQKKIGYAMSGVDLKKLNSAIQQQKDLPEKIKKGSLNILDRMALEVFQNDLEMVKAGKKQN